MVIFSNMKFCHCNFYKDQLLHNFHLVNNQKLNTLTLINSPGPYPKLFSFYLAFFTGSLQLKTEKGIFFFSFLKELRGQEEIYSDFTCLAVERDGIFWSKNEMCMYVLWILLWMSRINANAQAVNQLFPFIFLKKGKALCCFMCVLIKLAPLK